MTSLARTRASLLSLFIITCLNCLAVPSAAILKERDAVLSPTAQTQIVGPAGSGQFGQEVTVLPNGNIVVTDPYFDDGAKADVGAIYLYNGATLALISRLKGSTPGDRVGISAQKGVTVLTNGNYLVDCARCKNPSGSIYEAEAVAYGNGGSGTTGLISSANSVFGAEQNGISSFSHDAVRNRLFVGRKVSNIVTIRALP
jgi:Repeat of unknown function (DUF5650)